MSKPSIFARFFYPGTVLHKIKSLKMRILFPVAGFLSLVWFAVRVVPKPSRAAYPCMKVAFPVAGSFVVWLIGLFSSIVAFRQARKRFKQSRLLAGAVFLLVAAVLGFVSLQQPQRKASASIVYVEDPFGPNNPIGEAKGLFPGRVVWVHNTEATNESCTPDKWGDGYFLDKNCSQDVVDGMLSEALLKLTDAESEKAAWDQIFRHFNQKRGKGDVGYKNNETIFIKINAVHAWTTNSDGSIKNNGNYGNVDTSPQAVLAMLRQLVFHAGVPQKNIYIGDPYTHIFNHCLKKWRADFPDIHYMDKSGRDGRQRYKRNRDATLFFSDRGNVLDEKEDHFYTVMDTASYLLNIPAMKGHGLGGVTFFAKNFFGANSRSSAAHMHKGLHGYGGYHQPTRNKYGMYRVMVDLLGHENLGGKVLLFFMDGLWGASFEHEPPAKFYTPPFNGDWSNSIFLSQDPVALSSVCLDILQEEFPKTADQDGGEGRHWDANFPACDDYLHQAADSENWPEDIIYDPENDGTPLGSLGVHEHWNNPADRKYSRNLGTGDGIELIEISRSTPYTVTAAPPVTRSFVLHQNYPNPFNPTTVFAVDVPHSADVNMTIYDVLGRPVKKLAGGHMPPGTQEISWDATDDNGNRVAAGVYFCRLQAEDVVERIKLVLVK